MELLVMITGILKKTFLGSARGRAISLTSFTARQFQERIKVKDRLVSKALNRTKIMLIGDEREMGRLLA
ncbi:MAG: hypothetical protein WBN53_04870 [Thermodesulfobacteriota bacterium]